LGVLLSNCGRRGIKRFAVILAGGRGERFWPLSQPGFPKQFLSIFDNKPLLVQTMQRVATQFTRNERLLIIPKELKKLTAKYAGKENTVIEPLRRNTAPAICLAAMTLRGKFGDGVMHVMPADHLISPRTAFISALQYGQRLAEKGYLVTYGIKPMRPETGYGYIRLGAEIGRCRKNKSFHGAGFTEKPDKAKARSYVRSKRYLWNSGIFSFSIGTILDEIEKFVPTVHQGVASFLKNGRIDHFRRVPDISIDYGVMEKSDRLCVVQGTFKWDDVGSWLALERYFPKDNKSNITVGDVRVIKAENSIMYSREFPLRVYGVKDLIIVVSQHGILVCKKEHAQELKKLLNGFTKRRQA
jgi:mannose-1-phosphate guanylyltransferase/mannose-6-phosphate isomerase